MYIGSTSVNLHCCIKSTHAHINSNIHLPLYFNLTHTETQRPPAALTRICMVGKIEIERGKGKISPFGSHTEQTGSFKQSCYLQLRQSDRPVNARENNVAQTHWVDRIKDSQHFNTTVSGSTLSQMNSVNLTTSQRDKREVVSL